MPTVCQVLSLLVSSEWRGNISWRGVYKKEKNAFDPPKLHFLSKAICNQHRKTSYLMKKKHENGKTYRIV